MPKTNVKVSMADVCRRNPALTMACEGLRKSHAWSNHVMQSVEAVRIPRADESATKKDLRLVRSMFGMVRAVARRRVGRGRDSAVAKDLVRGSTAMIARLADDDSSSPTLVSPGMAMSVLRRLALDILSLESRHRMHAIGALHAAARIDCWVDMGSDSRETLFVPWGRSAKDIYEKVGMVAAEGEKETVDPNANM